MVFTDRHYFDNTAKSEITPIQAEGADPPTFENQLLLILEWKQMVEFVYKTHSIFVNGDETVEIQPYVKERKNKSAYEIVHEYIQLDKLQNKANLPHIKQIIACNPNVYPSEEIASQYI